MSRHISGSSRDGNHAVCVIYCFAVAKLFQALPGTSVMSYVDFYAATPPSKHFGAIAIVQYVVGGVQCAFIAIPLIQILSRLLKALEFIRTLESRVTSRFSTCRLFSTPNLQLRVLRKARQAMRGIYNAVFARKGFFGVESPHFDSLFLLREVYDVIMQTYQAYQMCRLLPRPTLNRFGVATLVINGWSSSLIHHFVKNVPLQRVLCHVCDMVLDLISAVGVPLLLMLKYLGMYDPTIGKIPDTSWWSIEAFILAMIESPLILFGSWLDALARLGFSIGLLFSLDDTKLLIKRRMIRANNFKQSCLPNDPDQFSS